MILLPVSDPLRLHRRGGGGGLLSLCARGLYLVRFERCRGLRGVQSVRGLPCWLFGS